MMINITQLYITEVYKELTDGIHSHATSRGRRQDDTLDDKSIEHARNPEVPDSRQKELG